MCLFLLSAFAHRVSLLLSMRVVFSSTILILSVYILYVWDKLKVLYGFPRLQIYLKSEVAYLFTQNDRTTKQNKQANQTNKHTQKQKHKTTKQTNAISYHGNLVWCRGCAIQCKPRPSPRPIS